MLRILPALAVLAFPACPVTAGILTWSCTVQKIGDEEAEPLPLTFRLDTVTRRAIVVGNSGFSDVQMHIGDDAFSFMETLESGAVHTTTITRDGLALHSRNTVIAGEFVPSQSTGRCSFD